MFSKNAIQVLGVFVFFLYSCGNNTVPKKTNVLNRNLPHSNASANKQPQQTQSNQTVFTRPEQVTRNAPTDNKPSENTRPQRVYEKPEPPENTEASSSQLAYRSPQYYRHIADSIQYYAKTTYEKNIDVIAGQLTQNPSQKKNPAVNSQWYASVNFNIRKPNFVVLHHTAQNSVDQTLFTFSISRTGTSAHYVIGRDGVAYQLLNDYVRAWHAGSSKWGNITDMNSCSLGIEMDNNGEEPFSDAQITALIKLLGYLKDQYDIPQANFIAHSDIAPERKSDPSKYFPWKRLADAGFGYWYDANNLQTPPADFNALLALRVIGYDIRDQAAAIKKFKLHYVQNDISPTLTDYDKKVLYSIYRKF
ncbi:MAG: N-acetylmuramoyl-L-alanine amidase [Niabella sp.]